MSFRGALLGLALGLVLVHGGRPAHHHAAPMINNCQPTVVVVGNSSLIIIDMLPHHNWPLVCMDNDLTGLEECLFPPVGTQLDIQCHNATEDQQPSDTRDMWSLMFTSDMWSSVFNMTSRQQLVDAIDTILSDRIVQGKGTMRDVRRIVQILGPALPSEDVLPAQGIYSTRSNTAGQCGPTGLEVPAELVGPSINTCCQTHDSCYNACGGFDACNKAFATCLDNACAALPRWAFLRRWLYVGSGVCVWCWWVVDAHVSSAAGAKAFGTLLWLQ